MRTPVERLSVQYDLTDASTRLSTGLSAALAPLQLTYNGQPGDSVPTTGVDRALAFARGPITTKLKTPGQPDQLGPGFAGPFLMSIDGPGGPDRFGVFRMFDLSTFPGTHAVSPVTARLINLSADALARLGGTDDPIGAPTGFTDLSHLFAYTVNDEGIPEDLASLGASGVYIANAPFIGLEGIYPNEMDVRPLADTQVQTILHHPSTGQQTTPTPKAGQAIPIRAVATLPNEVHPDQSLVVAVEQGIGGVNKLVLADAQLNARDEQTIPDGNTPTSPPTAVTVLHDWPTRLDPKGDTTVSRDLTVVRCGGSSLCVIPVQPAADPQSSPAFDMKGGLLSPGLGSGIGKIALGSDSSPRGMAYDPATQLLFVADGTAGLTVIDFSVPGGSRDEDHDGIDDRVLGTVDLGGAQAQAVAVWRDPAGGLVAAVATGSTGIYLVRVTPSDPVALASVNRNSGICATLTAIDAQYPPYREKFAEMEQGRAATGQLPPVPPDLTATLVNDVPGLDDRTRGMDGAVADGLSRLVLRLEINAASVPIGQVKFTLTSATSLASHHDTQFPFGTLSPDGFTNAATELTVDTQQGPAGRLVAVAVYTPPTLFPYDPNNASKHLSFADFTVRATDAAGNLLGQTSLRLVRPPVMVLHGLLGSAARAVGDDFKRVLADQELMVSFPDFSSQNVSGFDKVFGIIPAHIKRLRAAFLDPTSPDRSCTGTDCLIRGGLTALNGNKKITLTRVDAVAHSMGGVLMRWYTTDQLAQGGSSLGRRIQYPLSAELGSTPIDAGSGYNPMQLSRTSDQQYSRQDNFMQGDLGSVIVYGAPLRGSPFANALTHGLCGDDRGCYSPPPTSLPDAVLQAVLIGKVGLNEGFGADDAGAAIYDLSIGSSAYELFSMQDSRPVRVHAIGTTADGDVPLQVQALAALPWLKAAGQAALPLLKTDPLGSFAAIMTGARDATSDPVWYCPGFDAATGDLIVPLASQLANIVHRTQASGKWHNNQDSSKKVRDAVVTFLVDQLTGTDPLANFDSRFSADPVYPLDCGLQ